MKIITFICIILSQGLIAQTAKSVNILGMDFKVRPPETWLLLSIDTGLCLTETVNCDHRMPPEEPNTFGNLIFSVSEITDNERAQRNAPKDDQPAYQNIVSQFSGTKTMYKYEVGYGRYGVVSSTIYINSKTGALTGKPITKRQKKGTREIELVNYSSWIYFPVSDSLEILIAFAGTIAAYQQTDMDRAVSKFADYFFTTNDTLIDSLIAITNPYRFDQKILPLDSAMIFSTFLKYPILPGWDYDTTRTSSEIKINFLKMRVSNNTECNDANITMSCRLTPVDNKGKREENTRIPLSVLLEHYKNPKPKLSDSARLQLRDSTFANLEQHYFFSQNTTIEQAKGCNATPEITELLFIYIYCKPDERIKITVSLTYIADNYESERNFRHDYYRFISFLANSNDFEQFYLNNKP